MDINIARFDLVSMRLAVLCAESGSLSAAAKLAHCSISAGSQRLSALEDALGKLLFVRDYRGLRLTEAGDLFVRHARVILDRLEILWKQVACADHAGGPRAKHEPAAVGQQPLPSPMQSASLGTASMRLAFPGQPARIERTASGA